MCGRYALGAAHIQFLQGLQGQYARLFGNRGPNLDEEEDDDRGVLRLRGGGEGGEAVDAQKLPCDCDIKWERERDFWSRFGFPGWTDTSYNIAPRQRAPVIRRDEATGDAMIETMQWGLVPHWTKYPPTGPMNTINARSEALIDASSGGMWHALKGKNRCVIPAQGYYEWQKKGATKVAHFARLPLDGHEALQPPLMFFAGLWDTVKYVDPVPSKFVPGPDDDREPYPTGNPVPLSTFTIITTVPSKDMVWLHDRMPCILTSEEDIRRWLDLGQEPKGWVEGKGGTADLLVSYEGLDCYPVVPEVGKIGKSDPSYILPVAERKDGIKSFFMKQSPAKPKATKADVKEEAKPDESEAQPAVKPDAKFEVPGDGDKPSAKQDMSADNAKPEGTAVKEEDDKSKPDEEEAEPQSSQTSTGAGKRKREDEPRRGGRQTKILRPPKEEPKDQQSITSFFKSPKK